jgi:hypothetical protein
VGYTEKESDYLKKLDMWNRTTAKIRLTKTMLDKCIIDANTSVRTLAMLYGVHYDDMKNGEKVEVDAFFHTDEETVVRFYKTINRGDRRVSIVKIKKFAEVGDLIGLTTLSSAESNHPSQILLINITKGADNE